MKDYFYSFVFFPYRRRRKAHSPYKHDDMDETRPIDLRTRTPVSFYMRNNNIKKNCTYICIIDLDIPHSRSWHIRIWAKLEFIVFFFFSNDFHISCDDAPFGRSEKKRHNARAQHKRAIYQQKAVRVLKSPPPSPFNNVLKSIIFRNLKAIFHRDSFNHWLISVLSDELEPMMAANWNRFWCWLVCIAGGHAFIFRRCFAAGVSPFVCFIFLSARVLRLRPGRPASKKC